MPFELKISDVELLIDRNLLKKEKRLGIPAPRTSGELRISGYLTSGAFTGTEFVRFTETSGRSHIRDVFNCELPEGVGLPVTSDSSPRLTLRIMSFGERLDIDREAGLMGLGPFLPRQCERDMSGELLNPGFWQIFTDSFCDSATLGDAYDQTHGLSHDDIRAYYDDLWNPDRIPGSRPVLRFDFDANKYAMLEWKGEPCWEQRLWIGVRDPDRRVLLGFLSGHWSLPALRQAELVWFLDRLHETSSHPAAGLLLLPMSDYVLADGGLAKRLTPLCAAIPGAGPSQARLLADSFAAYRFSPDVEWRWNSELGWHCDGDHSLRNPAKPYSASLEDFQFIKEFFADVGRIVDS